MQKKILFLIPYPIKLAPSQRFRFEQYLEGLRASGFEVRLQSFLTSQNWQLFFNPGQFWPKVLAILAGCSRRVPLILVSVRYDFIFIHREAAPFGPPVIEWILAKLLRKKIIYDFDDAIWLTDRESEPAFLRLMKWRSKVASICKWSYRVSGGNEYLCSFAKRYNARVTLNPTTIDMNRLGPNAARADDANTVTTIGWTGSHSTLKYLKPLVSVFERLRKRWGPAIRILIIADRRPEFFADHDFLLWNPDTEIDDLRQIDIGIMPLPDDEWTRGKCGFKALQYFALGIPAVVSPVGVNTEIVRDGYSGFHCGTPESWEVALEKLINDKDMRIQMGERGRQTVIARYCVDSNMANFLSLFA